MSSSRANVRFYSFMGETKTKTRKKSHMEGMMAGFSCSFIPYYFSSFDAHSCKHVFLEDFSFKPAAAS